MKNDGLPVVQEAFPFLAFFGIASLAFFVGGLWQAGLLGLLLFLFCAYFFRNPERVAPAGDGVVASPADGVVIYIGPAKELDFNKEEMQKVSIFMSIFDVHVNRMPLDATVIDSRYHTGRFLAAFEDRVSEENERNCLWLESPSKQRVVLVQVAGLIARRIVCYPKKGDFVLKGQRMGLIRFGSRCDMYFPKSTEILIKKGDRVVGGETAIAKLQKREGKR